MAEIDQISNDLFFKLRNRFPNVQMGDENGAVTSNPKQARFFNFNFKTEEQTYGTVTCSLVDNQSLKIYFSQDITEDMEEHSQEHWFQFLRELRRFAKGHMLMFDVRDITKNQLDQNDIQFLSQYNKAATQISESRVAWERQGRFSNGDLNHVRIHVVHQNKMDENPHNRLSKIDKIFLVNSNNERFLLPFKSVLGAKAMAHYVANGGTPYDNHGQTIAKAVHEMKNLQRFNMATRNAQFESDNSQKVRDASAYLKEQLKLHLQKIANGRNVEENLNQLASLVTLDDARADVSEEMKQWFIQKHYNENLNNWIESAALAYKKFEEQQMNMVEKEDDSPIPSKDMTDVRAAKPAQIGDTIALYANDAKDEEMKKLLKTQPLRGMVSLIFADIAQRAIDDEVAILASRADAGEFTAKHKAMLQAYLKDLYSGNPNREEPAEKRHIKQNRKTAEEEFADSIMNLGNQDCGCQNEEELEEEPNEGNEFSGALAKAKAAGAKTFKVGDKEYPVKESSVPVNVRHSEGHAAADDEYMSAVEEMLQDLKERKKLPIDMKRHYGKNWIKLLNDANAEHGNTLRSSLIKHAEECIGVTESETTDEAGVCNHTAEGTMCPVHGLKECGSGYMEDTNEAAKPDFLDVDKDGDKEEAMKKALKDKEKKMQENELRRLAGLPVEEVEKDESEADDIYGYNASKENLEMLLRQLDQGRTDLARSLVQSMLDRMKAEPVKEENISEAQKVRFIGYNTTNYPLQKAIADKAYREGTLVKLTMDASGKPVAIISDPESAGEYEAYWNDAAGTWAIDFD